MEYDTGVPETVILGTLTIVCVSLIILSIISANGKTFFRDSSWCLLIGYIILMLCATIVFREKSESMRYSLCPFKSYMQLYDKLLAQLILNVAMFMPIGFLTGVIKKANTIQVLGIGCLLSFFIEIIQLLSKRGVFNIDDVIHNTLGCAIGYAAFRLCNSILKVFT